MQALAQLRCGAEAQVLYKWQALTLGRSNSVRIDGVAVRAEDVEELAVHLARNGAYDTSHRLLRALREQTQVLELNKRDRNRLLVVLTDPPPHFHELHRVLSGGSPRAWGQLKTT